MPDLAIAPQQDRFLIEFAKRILVEVRDAWDEIRKYEAAGKYRDATAREDMMQEHVVELCRGVLADHSRIVAHMEGLLLDKVNVTASAPMIIPARSERG